MNGAMDNSSTWRVNQMKIIKKRGKKKLYRQFQMELPQTLREEIDRMIKDHITTYDIWDSEHFSNAYWNITLHLQPWED